MVVGLGVVPLVRVYISAGCRTPCGSLGRRCRPQLLPVESKALKIVEVEETLIMWDPRKHGGGCRCPYGFSKRSGP